MRVIIAGSREGADYHDVVAAMRAAGWEDAVTEVVSGGARGVDALGEQWAAGRNIPVKRFPAEWHKHGRAAGPIRNGQMAAYADALVAVWNSKSRGTSNMIDQARAAGLQVHIHYLTRSRLDA